VKSIVEIQSYLSSMGTIIYTGNRIADLELMMEELSECYQNGILSVVDYQKAKLVILHEIKLIRSEIQR
jgi:uncharacterized protein YqgQ